MNLLNILFIGYINDQMWFFCTGSSKLCLMSIFSICIYVISYNTHHLYSFPVISSFRMKPTYTAHCSKEVDLEVDGLTL